MKILPPVIQLEDAVKADILHRGDLVFCRFDHDNRNWAEKLIIDFQQNREMIEYPLCEISHVMVVTHKNGGSVANAAQEWRGWSIQPMRGKEVDIKNYKRCQLIIMRYEGWFSDEQRYDYCDRVIKICHARYSISGCIHTALGFLFPKLPGGRFCSESAEQPAEDLGIDYGQGFIREVTADRVSPGRLSTSPLLKCVAVVYSK